MITISSRDNPRYKELKLLGGDAGARRRTGLTVLDGVHLCAAYLERFGAPRLCAVSQGGLAHPEAGPLAERCDALGVPCLILPDAMLRAVSPVEHGVGLVFLVPVPEHSAPTTLVEDAILLDALQDPGNLGSILRSAAAAGIRKVICGRGTTAAWSPKVLRAGMGAHFVLDIVEHAELQTLLEAAQVNVVATSSHAAHALYDVDLRQPVAWLFGNEGRGVAKELSKRAQQYVSIPHPGPMESLNVAACAAICLFEQVRQRRL